MVAERKDERTDTEEAHNNCYGNGYTGRYILKGWNVERETGGGRVARQRRWCVGGLVNARGDAKWRI